VAFFALAGRPPFEGETDHDIVYRVLNEPAPSLEQGGVRGAPAALEALIARCLEKDRELRPATIDEVRRTLEEIARGLPWTEADARAWWAVRGAELVPDDVR
jgi:serine/threonine-protein kinase